MLLITKDNLKNIIGKPMRIIANEKAGIFRHRERVTLLVVRIKRKICMIDPNGEFRLRGDFYTEFSQLFRQWSDSYEFYYIDLE